MTVGAAQAHISIRLLFIRKIIYFYLVRFYIYFIFCLLRICHCVFRSFAVRTVVITELHIISFLVSFCTAFSPKWLKQIVSVYQNNHDNVQRSPIVLMCAQNIASLVAHSVAFLLRQHIRPVLVSEVIGCDAFSFDSLSVDVDEWRNVNVSENHGVRRPHLHVRTKHFNNRETINVTFNRGVCAA